MRCHTWTHSAASCWDRTIRSSVWHVVQPIKVCFCSWLPVMLRSHSPFESWRDRSCVLCNFKSTVALDWALICTGPGLSSSYPTARIRTAYWPGSRRFCGKLYRPCASLTTVTVIVASALLALTSTPSIAPSSCEETRPASAEAKGLCASVAFEENHETTRAIRSIDAHNRHLLMTSPREMTVITFLRTL